MTSMSLGADAQEVKANVLEFIEKYGCEVAPDEAFDALAHKIFAFQFAHNMQYRAYCMSRRVTPQMLSDGYYADAGGWVQDADAHFGA